MCGWRLLQEGRLAQQTQALQIDAAGLGAMGEKARQKGSTVKTLAARTICEEGFRNLTYIRDLEPMAVSEPPQLLGDDTAPNPSEAALAALGSCISVGLLANATAKDVTLTAISIELEGDIDISAVWGTGDTPPEKVAGFTAVRMRIQLDSPEASREELEEIKDSAVRWSPVGNTFQNPLDLSAELA